MFTFYATSLFCLQNILSINASLWKLPPHFSYFQEDIKIYIKSSNKKATLKLWMYAHFLVFLYNFVFNN